MSTPAQLTSLLANQTLARLERMRLLPLHRKTNRSRGEHLAGKGGTSTEFNDYRDYSPGDDTRYVDWNIFSRLERPFIKLYRHEEELQVVIIIDVSASMNFGTKLERARQLAAAFAVMGLMNQERVSLYACSQLGTAPQVLAPCTGRLSFRKVFEFIERLSAAGDVSLEGAIDEVLKLHRGRGVAIVLSDFLTFGNLERPFNRLSGAGLELMAIQLLSPAELDPELTGDVRFVDAETGQMLDVSAAGDLLTIYREHLENLQRSLGENCRTRSGRFLSLDASQPLEDLLFDSLRRKGWLQ